MGRVVTRIHQTSAGSGVLATLEKVRIIVYRHNSEDETR